PSDRLHWLDHEPGQQQQDAAASSAAGRPPPPSSAAARGPIAERNRLVPGGSQRAPAGGTVGYRDYRTDRRAPATALGHDSGNTVSPEPIAPESISPESV